MLANHVQQKQYPPYVEFETRAEEDREKTIATGRPVFKDVDYALVRALGSKDCVEKNAVEWLAHLDHQAMIRAYNPEWAKFFREQYTEWKRGEEVTQFGTHIKNWAGLSPGVYQTLIAARITTIEAVADANEESLTRIGMGSRDLKQRAQAWLDASTNSATADELAHLRQKTANQDKASEARDEEIRTLRSQVERLIAAQDGKPESDKPAAAQTSATPATPTTPARPANPNRRSAAVTPPDA